MILNTSKSNDVNRHRRGVEKLQVEPEPAPEADDYSISTALEKLIDNKVESQVENALATIPNVVEEAIGQLFFAATLRDHPGIGTVVYDAKELVTPDAISTAMLGETIKKHVDKYFEACKAANALGKRLLCSDVVLAVIASFV